MLTGECWWVVVSCRWCYIINHWLNKLTSDILLVNFTETPVKFSRENQGTWTMRETSCWNYSSFCAVLYVPDALKLLADTHAICWQLVGATTDVSNSPPVHSRDGPKFGEWQRIPLNVRLGNVWTIRLNLRQTFGVTYCSFAFVSFCACCLH